MPGENSMGSPYGELSFASGSEPCITRVYGTPGPHLAGACLSLFSPLASSSSLAADLVSPARRRFRVHRTEGYSTPPRCIRYYTLRHNFRILNPSLPAPVETFGGNEATAVAPAGPDR